MVGILDQGKQLQGLGRQFLAGKNKRSQWHYPFNLAIFIIFDLVLEDFLGEHTIIHVLSYLVRRVVFLKHMILGNAGLFLVL